MRRIIGIGHSHLVCFDDAAADLAKADPDLLQYTSICFVRREFHPPFVVQDGAHVANKVWLDVVRQYADEPGTEVVLAVPGAEWWYWSLTPGPSPFDFVDPLHDDGVPLIGQVIPYDLFMNKARLALRYVRFIADAVRSVAPLPLSLSPPPPPTRDVEAMFTQTVAGVGAPGRRHQGLVHVVKGLAPTIEQYGFSPASFRLKVWRASMRAVEEICEEAGITYLAPPAAALDADGFLKTEMVSDLVHANRHWAHLQLNRMLANSRQPQGAM